MTRSRNYSQNWLPSIFDDFFDNNWMNKTNATAPAINVLERRDAYVVEVAAPGMTKKDFNIHIDENNNLIISMEKKEEHKEGDNCGCNGEAKGTTVKCKDEESRYLRREFYYSKFQQALILPDDVDKMSISAQVENGILSVTLPKQTPEQKEKLLQHIEVK
ncbi:MAG: Hsp20/alpha crystallin family protein [Bacteroidales bacterium]|nr:Hsp20/alpha crystallin family protein [Bacteroidales bacterium]